MVGVEDDAQIGVVGQVDQLKGLHGRVHEVRAEPAHGLKEQAQTERPGQLGKLVQPGGSSRVFVSRGATTLHRTGTAVDSPAVGDRSHLRRPLDHLGVPGQCSGLFVGVIGGQVAGWWPLAARSDRQLDPHLFPTPPHSLLAALHVLAQGNLKELGPEFPCVVEKSQ